MLERLNMGSFLGSSIIKNFSHFDEASAAKQALITERFCKKGRQAPVIKHKGPLTLEASSILHSYAHQSETMRAPFVSAPFVSAHCAL